jgi:hypothetical protein
LGTKLSMADKAIAILGLTQDGDLLEPKDLKLVEQGVNGLLNDEEIVMFNSMHQSFTSGTNPGTSHWFHGIEYLTQDRQGYV